MIKKYIGYTSYLSNLTEKEQKELDLIIERLQEEINDLNEKLIPIPDIFSQIANDNKIDVDELIKLAHKQIFYRYKAIECAVRYIETMEEVMRDINIFKEDPPIKLSDNETQKL